MNTHDLTHISSYKTAPHPSLPNQTIIPLAHLKNEAILIQFVHYGLHLVPLHGAEFRLLEKFIDLDVVTGLLDSGMHGLHSLEVLKNHTTTTYRLPRLSILHLRTFLLVPLIIPLILIPPRVLLLILHIPIIVVFLERDTTLVVAHPAVAIVVVRLRLDPLHLLPLLLADKALFASFLAEKSQQKEVGQLVVVFDLSDVLDDVVHRALVRSDEAVDLDVHIRPGNVNKGHERYSKLSWMVWKEPESFSPCL